jgi:hypothetical protein
MVNCLVDHPTNHVTMVSPFAATAASWLWQISKPYLFGRGWERAVFEGFV